MCFAFITYGLCMQFVHNCSSLLQISCFFSFLFWHSSLFNVQAQFPADPFPSCLQGNLTWDISGVFDIAVNVFFIDIWALISLRPITNPTPTFIPHQISITKHLRHSVRSTLHFGTFLTERDRRHIQHVPIIICLPTILYCSMYWGIGMSLSQGGRSCAKAKYGFGRKF